jgi:hypothetical protein
MKCPDGKLRFAKASKFISCPRLESPHHDHSYFRNKRQIEFLNHNRMPEQA